MNIYNSVTLWYYIADQNLPRVVAPIEEEEEEVWYYIDQSQHLPRIL